MNKEEYNRRKVLIGFKTVILGGCLLILELLWLPVVGYLQKLQVSGNGFYTDFMKYAGEQPYPLIFLVTAAIILSGAYFMYSGYKGSNEHQ